jgi:uncharacterized tellurite resistance protein B-like protein
MTDRRPKQEFPPEADEATVIVLMSVVKADEKVLKEELDLIQSFFSHQLEVSPERLASIGALVARYAVEPLPEKNLIETLEKLPESARHILYSVALEIAVVDDDLDDSERDALTQIGHSFGLSDQEIQARLLEVLRRKEDAFSLLGVDPDSDWPEIEAAYEAEKEKYSPSGLSKLGVAFQSLALERLERIDWAYQTLVAVRKSSGQSDEVEQNVERTTREKSWLDSASEIPEEFKAESDLELWERLPDHLERSWQDGERDWDILSRRLGFSGELVPSLDALGQEYGISRERVRQIENKGRRVVRSLLLTGSCQDQSIHPRVVALCRSIFGAIQASIVAPVTCQNDFTTRLEKELAWNVFSATGLYPIVEEWLELTHVRMLDETFVFHSHSTRDISNFEVAARALLEWLQGCGGRASAQKVREGIYRELSTLRCPPEDFFRLVPGVSLTRNGVLALAGAEPDTPAPPVELEQTTEGWDREEIGKLIEGFFSMHFLNSVAFRILGLHIQSETGLSYRIASDIIRQHPAVIRERVRGRMFASLRRNWREEESAKGRFTKPTAQELVDEFLRDKVRGDVELALNDVLEDLARETGASISGLADYVERSEHCRRFDRGGQIWVTSAPYQL